MKKIIAMLCATAIVATPALAQTAPATPEAATPEAAAPATPDAAAPDAAAPAATSSEGNAANTDPAESGAADADELAVAGIAEPSMAASQDRVISVFEAAGYTDVRIVDTTYAVKATTPEGETVTVVVDLATMPGAAAAPDASSGADGSAPVDAGRFGGPAASEPGESEPAAAD